MASAAATGCCCPITINGHTFSGRPKAEQARVYGVKRGRPVPNVRGTGRPVSHADWRSIHAYTSRSFHRRCFPILYVGSPHSFHLSRTVRSGMARIAATSRDDRSRLEPPSVPFCGITCCPSRGCVSAVAGVGRLSRSPGVAGLWVSVSASATAVSAAIRADTREDCTCTLRSLLLCVMMLLASSRVPSGLPLRVRRAA